ncbi:MAG: PQQ-dependent sugar dehydrogenase [Acidobacteriota bacterium]|nr:PQQ-dependent sugar dehydrogenase [Acidobacteriota bacterium]
MASPKFLALAVLLVATQWVPPTAQTACKKSPTPSTADPWASLAISESATTSDGVRIGVQVLLSSLEIPWSLAFAPDGRLFFTERIGRVRAVVNGAVLAQPMLTLADVRAVGEGGVLGLALHPNFAQNHFVYIAYTSTRADGVPVNRVARFRESNNALGEMAVLIDNIPAADNHDGARLRFGPDGKLYVTTGDAGNPALAQTLSSLSGKILRINDDGTTPGDNPFGSPVWTWGHRHPQGIDWHPTTGQAWATEHGQTGNDELNVINRGANYGWPVIQGIQWRPDMVLPVLFYNPAIAPSGLSFYTGTRIAQFRNNIFFTALRGQHIHRVVLDTGDSTVPAAEERLFEGRFGRIRDVITGPDGALYFCTSNRDGRIAATAVDDRILRIVPLQ